MVASTGIQAPLLAIIGHRLELRSARGAHFAGNGLLFLVHPAEAETARA
jgi:hypothetical protein